MKLFVDYTNWRGDRAWREIVATTTIVRCVAPDDYDDSQERSPKYPAPGASYWGLHVLMVDRDHAPRVLHVSGIHGFYEGDAPPEPRA